MVRLWLALTALGITGTADAAADRPPPAPMKPGITVHVDLEAYSAEHNTYSGGVTVSAHVCNDVTYNTRIDVSGVKDAADARARTAPTIAKLVDNIRKASAGCH